MEKLKTIKIKGKDYVEVPERIKHFRTSKDYEGWSMTTEFKVLNESVAICKAVITDANGTERATGHAQEDRNNGMINKTSYVENCETSAIGRALACLGIGVDTSVASANEVANAIHTQMQQEKKAPAKAPTQKVMFNPQQAVSRKQ